MTRTILVVTGTRAEYGLLQSSMAAITDHEALSLEVVVTGMHLSPQHGHTADEIEADGFEVSREVYMLLEGDTGTAMAKSLGIGITGMADAIHDLEPDVVMVLGDRDEALAAGVAAAHMNIPVAHIHGGQSMSGAIIDDSIRHALTKFAHIHFPVSELSASRIRKLGEEPWRITTVGAPGLDAVLDADFTSSDTLRERLDLPADEPFALVIQHSVTTEADQAGQQMRATLEAILEADLQAVVVYPNADPGGKRMIEVIDSFGDDRLRPFDNLPRADFLGCMAAADVMVGNSSSAIIEAPSFELPVVDVGPRQEGRERAENTLSVPHDRDAIRQAIRRCLEDDAVRRRSAECENPYDYGGAGDRIAERLAEFELNKKLLQKQLTY
ncbi:UDP-N-acetylglucosamine 2-epimerase [Natrialbaceae archaeon A-CW1-1]